jgi:hypothetical protein
MTCVILQDDSESAEDQSCAADLSSRSSEDLFGRESESIEEPLGSLEYLSTQVPPRRRTRKSHYVPPPPVSTNPESRPIINGIANNFTYLSYNQWEDTTFDGTCHKR